MYGSIRAHTRLICAVLGSSRIARTLEWLLNSASDCILIRGSLLNGQSGFRLELQVQLGREGALINETFEMLDLRVERNV